MAKDINYQNDFQEEIKVKEPRMYIVILHNDHYTTMEFVVEILRKVFHKSTPEATKIMLDVHEKGKGVVGHYTRDIAETKTIQVREIAKQAEYPLKCSFEPAP